LINWNSYKYTHECLSSIKEANHSNHTYKIIVVDNGSEKQDAKNLTWDKRVDKLILNEKNKGYVVASNQAIKYAVDKEFDYILQLDNDTVIDKECIEELVKIAETYDKIGIVGAKIFYHNEPTRLQWAGEDMNFWTGDIVGLSRGITRVLGRKEFDDSKYNEVKEVDYVVSWCSLSRRKVWEEVGLLDESFFFGWEDDDFCIRVKKAGYRIFWTPKAKLWHRYSSAFALDGHLQYYGPKNRFKFMRKHATIPQLITFYLFFFIVHFWLATAYYLLWVRKPKIWLRFLKGAWDGVRCID